MPQAPVVCFFKNFLTIFIDVLPFESKETQQYGPLGLDIGKAEAVCGEVA